jgi:hypothetical protein
MEGKDVIIEKCELMECVYNKESKCHAKAITMGGPDHECPECDTFMASSKKGGIDGVAEIGACRASECSWNMSFECSAASVVVGRHKNHADCQTYKAV